MTSPQARDGQRRLWKSAVHKTPLLSQGRQSPLRLSRQKHKNRVRLLHKTHKGHKGEK